MTHKDRQVGEKVLVILSKKVLLRGRKVNWGSMSISSLEIKKGQILLNLFTQLSLFYAICMLIVRILHQSMYQVMVAILFLSLMITLR